MKHLCTLLLALMLTLPSLAQNKQKKEIESIKNSGNYYFASSGQCPNISAARNKAIDNLILDIYENCNPNFAFVDEDTENALSKRLFLTFQDDFKKKSNYLIINNDSGKAEVFCYLKKSDFMAICDERKALADTYCNEGVKVDFNQKENSSIGDALRYYYWSLITCYSHPYGSELKMQQPNSSEMVSMKDWVYERIFNLLNTIQFNPVKKPAVDNGSSVVYEVVVTDGADKVPWLNFYYYDGQSQVENSVNSGLTTLELFDKDMGKVDMQINLENRNEAEARAKEVYNVMKTLDYQIYFRPAEKIVDVKKGKKKTDEGYHDSRIVEGMKATGHFVDNHSVRSKDYLDIMKQIENAVRGKDISGVRHLFTESGYNMLDTLLNKNGGRHYVLGTPEYTFLSFKEQLICRGMKMQFNFEDNVGFIREVVFRFNKNTRKVESIAFRLSDMAEIDILGRENWNDTAKMVLVNFLEDYQTAYALKRKTYLRQIFSDNALIISGTVLEVKKQGEGPDMKTEIKVKYDTLSKSEYMNRLDNVFARNKYVNIRFLDTEFTQHRSGDDIYGVQVKQEYISSRYGDVGYLFLMVDLRGKSPVIHVRTWEPEKVEKPIDFDDIRMDILN